MLTNEAESVALQALGWIISQDGMRDGFLGASGLASSDLSARAGDPEFLGFVLDFLLSDEAALVAFASDVGLAPEIPARARHSLPGGDAPDWT